MKAHVPSLLALTGAACAAIASPGVPPGGEMSQAVDVPATACCQADLVVGGAAAGTSGGGGATPVPGASGAPQPAGTLQATIAVGTSPRGLALDGQGRVWVAVSGAGSLARLEGEKVAQRISVDAPVDLAFDAAGRAWVASDGGLFGFDASGSPLQAAAGGPAEAVAASGEFVYASFPKEGAVRRYPVSRLGLGAPITLPGGAGSPHDLLVDQGGRLWVALGDANLVARYDNPAATPSAPVLISGVGGDPRGLARDGANRVLSIGNSAIFTVSQATPRPLVVDSLLTGASRMAIDKGGVVWVAATTANRLVGVKADGTLASPAPLGLAAPADVVADSQGRLWVSNELGGTVMRFSGS